jgi:hypothetical protein
MNVNLQLKMITFSAVIVLLSVSLLYLNQNSAGAASLNSDTQSIRVVRMHLQGLHENKLHSADHALRRLPGITEIKIDPGQQNVTVWVNIDRTNLKEIERSLHNAGFTPIYR